MVNTFRKEKTPTVRRVSYDIASFAGIDGYRDESTLTPRFCCYGYNISLSGGMIKESVGVDAGSYNCGSTPHAVPSLISFGDTLKRLHHTRLKGEEYLIAFSNSGKFYKLNVTLGEENFTPLVGIEGFSGSDAIMINYYFNGEDTLLVFYSGGVGTFNGEEVVLFSSAPLLDSATMLYERVFGIDVSANKLYFSAQLNPTDFSTSSGGGSISFMDEGGKLQKVMVFNGAVYVFREYSIERLSVFGAPEDYVLTKVCTFSNKLEAKTVCNVGGTVYLMAGDFLYTFNGYSTVVIQRGLTALIENASSAVATFFDDRYYLACRLKTRGEVIGDEENGNCLVNNGLIYINVLTDEVGVSRGFDIVDFCPLLNTFNKRILVVFGNFRAHRAGTLNYDGRLFTEPLQKLFKSAKNMLGSPETLKHLKRVSINTESDLDISVTQGGITVVKHVLGSNKKHVVPFFTIGYDFGFSISTSAPFKISGLTLEFDYVERYN